jgi:hypothetical protein
MSIKDRALAAAEYDKAAKELDRVSAVKRGVLALREQCRQWCMEHLETDPAEILVFESYSKPSERVIVNLEDDIFLVWCADAGYMQSALRGKGPGCWLADLNYNVTAWGKIEKGLGEGGWEKARIDVSLSGRITDLASLGRALAGAEKHAAKKRGA